MRYAARTTNRVAVRTTVLLGGRDQVGWCNGQHTGVEPEVLVRVQWNTEQKENLLKVSSMKKQCNNGNLVGKD